MNKERRKTINEIQAKLSEVQTDLEAVKDEEEEAYNNLPESLQDSERGDAMQAAIEALDDAYSSVGDAIDYLDNIL